MATGFYVCARLSIGLCNLWFAYLFRHFRLYHIWNFLSATIPSLMWIGALWVDYPYNLAVQWASFIFGINYIYVLSYPRLVSLLYLICRDVGLWTDHK